MSNFTLNDTLTTHEFYVLLALTQNPFHGYAVRNQVAADSNSSLIMTTGTTYKVLNRLLTRHLLEAIPADERQIARRYRLTETGRRRLAREITRLERIITHAHYKLGRKLGAFGRTS